MQTTRRDFVAGLGAAAVSGLGARLASAGWASDAAVAPDAPRFYVASVTPVDRRQRFDDGLMRDLLALFGEKGVDGVLVLGTSGEFSSFSLSERKKITDFAVKHKGKLEVMCQVGTPNLPETLDLLAHAAAAGVDKALVLPPFYYKNPSLEGLVSFFSPILEAARIPVLLYHIPGTSGVPITLELVGRLSRYEKLYGIKDSSGNQEGLLAFIREFPKLKVLTGSNRLLEIALKSGGGGAITGTGNVVAAETVELFRQFRAGKDTAAAQARLVEVGRMMPADIPGMKFVLGELGLRESWCRPPFGEVSEARKAELKAAVAKLKNA